MQQPPQNTIGENIQNTIRPITETINNAVRPITETVNTVTENVTNNVSNTLNDFSSKGVVNASNEFLDSNSIVAKFAFVILILILFVFLFSIGIRLIGFFTENKKSPYLVKGLIDGTNSLVISQDPRSSTSITLQRSNNNKTGIEFTWSVWLLIKSGGNNGKTYSHIFNKGDTDWNATTGISNVNNGPGLYLSNLPTNTGLTLHVVMDTEKLDGTSQELDITSVPLNKWFNVCIRMQNIVMDVYINGTNSGRTILSSVPRQNFNDINICQNGGFVGNLSDLRYFDYALGAFDINSVVWKGPTLQASKNGTIDYGNTTNYISNSWYFSKM
jgi:hypothetical protein